MEIRAFIFDEKNFQFKVIDQTKLPSKLDYVDINGTLDGFNAVKIMLVRGAPCIAAVACLSIITELNRCIKDVKTTEELCNWLDGRRKYLTSARPTAVNLKQALDRLVAFACKRKTQDVEALKVEVTKFCLQAIRIGQEANLRLGDFGVSRIKDQDFKGDQRVSILTHCNTGALATVGHGTALGVIRSLHKAGLLERAYCTETRPYNQGSRLTAWELVTENIPATLIADNMVAYLMRTRKLHAVIVGADRVAANGDTANKIGTLQIAELATIHKLPFYVAAPTQTVDLETKSGQSIVIEERPADELRNIGPVQLAPENVDVWNPCFDITPANLITGFITELGFCEPNDLVRFMTAPRTASDDALF